MPGYVNYKIQVFQSTPSAWRVTTVAARDTGKTKISIHTLRVEGDLLDDDGPVYAYDFNPHPPRGG